MPMLEDVTIAPKTLFTIGSFNVTETMFTTLLVTGVLLVFAVVVRLFFIPRWEKEMRKKSGFRLMLEWVVNMFDSNATDLNGGYKNFTGTLYFGLCAFIFCSILTELFGLRSPITDLNVDLVLGLATFLTVQIIGIIKHRSRRLRHFATVIPIVTDAVVPFSMALRLFGSVFSGYIVLELVFELAYPIVYPLVFYLLFTIFHCIMQTYIFMFLSMNFVAEAMD